MRLQRKRKPSEHIQVITGLALPCAARTAPTVPDPPQPSALAASLNSASDVIATSRGMQAVEVWGGGSVLHFGNVFCMSAAAEPEDGWCVCF